jgi:hypothetical protein
MRLSSPTSPAAFCLAASLALAGCAGGGGGGGVAPVTPTGPASLTLTGPSVGLLLSTAGAPPDGAHFNVSVGPTHAAGEDLKVTVTDPDVAAPTGFSQINFNGNETIRVQQASTGFDETFTASQYQGPVFTLINDSAGRPLFYSQWGTGADSAGFQNVFRIVQLNKGPYVDRVGATPVIANNPTQYVFLTEVGGVQGGSNHQGSLQLIGAATTDMPTTGTLHFDGQAYGQAFEGHSPVPEGGLSTLQGTPFVARAVMDVDIAGKTVSGTINSPTYQTPLFGPPPGTPFTVTFTGALSGAQFSGPAAATWHATGMTGTVNGGFYGPAAAEAGDVFALTSTATTGDAAGDRIAGGFVAGR